MVDFNSLPQAIQALNDGLQLIKKLMENFEQPDEIFTIDQCAEFLNLSRQTVYDMVQDKKTRNRCLCLLFWLCPYFPNNGNDYSEKVKDDNESRHSKSVYGIIMRMLFLG